MMETSKEQTEKDKTMPRIFYGHLLQIEEVTVKLDDDGSLEATEKEEFIDLIDGTCHNHILNLILSHLPEEHHEEFLSRFHEAPHDPELLSFLKKTVKGGDIEAMIRAEAKKIKEEINKMIEESHHR
jgi:hypothetical protein